METITIGKGVEYNHTLRNDKHFFAGYFNLADDNIETVKRNYKAKYGKELFKDEHLTKIAEADYQIRMQFLQQQLPVLRMLDLPYTHVRFERQQDKIMARRRYLLNSFKLLTDLIKNLRNFYTHYYHAPLNISESNFKDLNDIFLSVVVEVRNIKKKNDHTRQILKESLAREYELLYKEKENTLREKKQVNKKVDLSPASIHNAIFNDAFAHMIAKNKENGDLSVRKYYQFEYNLEEDAENGISISQNGLVFLLGMFLTRRESEELRGRIKGFKARVISTESTHPSSKDNSFRFMATHWVFSYLSFKGAKNQLHNTFSKENLLMQIVDELSKVPDELYQCLSENRKLELIEDINEYYKTGNEIESMEASQVMHPVIRKRYEDKFNYFVLRYLDEFVNFPTLRFQVCVGNYVHDSREKVISGTRYITDRKVKDPILIFGKLSRIAEMKEDYFIANTIPSPEEGWEMFPAPYYNITNQNIPIFLNIDLKNAHRDLVAHITNYQNSKPIEKKNKEKATKFDICNQIFSSDNNDIYFGKPVALLSLNELPSLLYELLINAKTPEQIENILRQKIADKFKRIRHYQPGADNKDVPISKKLRRSLSEDVLDADKLLRAFQKEINVSQDKLDMIEKYRLAKQKRERPFIFYSNEIGHEASWLADDLKMFMPLETRANWKGYQHSQLQFSLAYFSQNQLEPISLLSTCWDFNDTKHLRSADIKKTLASHSHFDTMYEAYLEYRSQVFESLAKGLTEYKSNKKVLKSFLHQQHVWSIFNERNFRVSSTEKQKEELLTQPFLFSRGIFDEKPTFIPSKRITENPELFANWYQYSYHPHSFQQFYDWERDYTVIYKQAMDNQEFLDNKKKLNLQEQEALVQRKTDLHIKTIKTQDLFLKCIADAIHQDIFDEPFKATLSNIYITREERLTIQQTAKEQHKRAPGDHSPNILNDSFIWNKAIPFTWPQITPFNVKIKDLRKRRRFLESKKVKTLLSYEPSRQWTLSELEETLTIGPDSYETIRREELLKEIQRLEAAILSWYPSAVASHPTELEMGGHPNFRYYVATGLLKKQNLANDTEIQWIKDLDENKINRCKAEDLKLKPEIIQKAFLLVLLRNKFAHNELPNKEIFDMLCGFMNFEEEPIRLLKSCRIMVDFVISTTNDFIEKIGK